MYTREIIEMLTWPILIIVSYQVVKFLMKKYESKLEDNEMEE
jgi:hypothetical protein